jgi:hypothetical protein
MLRKFESNRVTLNCWNPERARRATLHRAAPRRPHRRTACAHAEAPENHRSEVVRHGHCAPKGGDARQPPRSVPHGLRALTGARTRAPPLAGAPPHVATASAPMPRPHVPTWTRTASLRSATSIKTLLSSPCASCLPSAPPSSTIVATAGGLPPPLMLVTRKRRRSSSLAPT